ncbi:MAG: class I SAM-dependent methyltransferase [Clostridiaceae bacterium]
MIDWLCDGTSRVLDFGCGNGTLLFLCALRGTTNHLGIDLSQEAILCAKRKAERMSRGMFSFWQGGVEQLSKIADASFDAIILSNIIDNLYPEDANLLVDECARILQGSGKVLVKLNPHLSKEQIADWSIKEISGNLLDDGLLLWNNTTEEWRDFFSSRFNILRENEVYYPEHDQTNRLFYLIKS